MPSKTRSRRKRNAEAAAQLAGRNDRVLARNRRALWQYEILQRFEAGIELRGSEIKALRLGRGSIAEAYCRPRDRQLWLIGAHIGRYEPSGADNHEPHRDRRLLLHRREIAQLEAAFDQRRLTLVPIQLYLKRGVAKLEVGIGRGKRQYEKRQVIAERETNREIQRALRRNGAP